MKRRAFSFERRLNLLAFCAGLPGSAIALIVLWGGSTSNRIRLPLTLVIVGTWFACAIAVRRQVVYPLRTFSNLLGALRDGDFSFRMRADGSHDALDEAVAQVNAMAETLREQRLSALEATALLRKAVAEIDVAIFAFDGERRLRLVNRAGERLMGKEMERILNLTAGDLGLTEYLDSEPAGNGNSAVVRASFPGGSGVWSTRSTEFREGGRPHTLLVITDLTRPLRQEELAAWQRLVRVLGHEINNSLAPVKSISRSLLDLLSREPLPHDWREDAISGLTTVESRSDALARFTVAYARLARLPLPHFQPMSVRDWVHAVVKLETRLRAQIMPAADIWIRGDRDQLEQLLINLLRNAVDAAGVKTGKVTIGWKAAPMFLEVTVADNGPGLASAANLFVPFFTTKPEGSGIGLVLSRQIAEAHGGDLTLSNRQDEAGCEARLRLPL